VGSQAHILRNGTGRQENTKKEDDTGDTIHRVCMASVTQQRILHRCKLPGA
jgi:hypothetical protein